MTKKEEALAEKRTQLAEKRTELAHERTIMAYVRTATTIILFAIAFYGFSEDGDFFFYASLAAVAVGVLLLLFAVQRATKHLKEIKRIKEFFKHTISLNFKP